MSYPSGTEIANVQYSPWWLLTGVNHIDMRMMSTGAYRREWAAGHSGSHMSADNPEVCFIETKFQRNFSGEAYLINLKAELKTADLLAAGNQEFSGQYYAKDHNYSHEVMAEAEEYALKNGINCVLRYSSPLLAEDKREKVIALYPSALDKLEIVNIHPLGDTPAGSTITLIDGKVIPIEDYYPAEKKDFSQYYNE